MTKEDSTTFKLCRCGRHFDPVTGVAFRLGDYYRPNIEFKPSRQPCNVCDKQYYIERAMKILRDEGIWPKDSIEGEEPDHDIKPNGEDKLK